MSNLKTILLASAVLATSADQARAACSDMVSGGETFQQFCQKEGYSYRYQQRSIDWAPAGPAKIITPYAPQVLKTDTLTVNACLASPPTSVTDTHAVTYMRSDSLALTAEVMIAGKVSLAIGIEMLGTLGIEGSVGFKAGATDTSLVSEQATYTHALTVSACTARKSDWQVLGMQNATVQVPLIHKDQFRYYCSGYLSSTDWSPWYTCATTTSTATGKSSNGNLSKAVTTSAIVSDVACTALGAGCAPVVCPVGTKPMSKLAAIGSDDGSDTECVPDDGSGSDGSGSDGSGSGSDIGGDPGSGSAVTPIDAGVADSQPGPDAAAQGQMQLGQTCIVGSSDPGESCAPGLACSPDVPGGSVGLCQRIVAGPGSGSAVPTQSQTSPTSPTID